MPPATSSADRTAGRAGALRPRRPGWKRLFDLWSPDLDALVFHARWRLDGVDSTMKTEGEHDRVGSLAGGYNRLARDYDRALHLARLSAVQLFMVQRAREMSWTRAQIDGAAESYPFRLNLAEITRLAAVARSGVFVQHGKLIAARIFLDLGDGRHILNKDYRTWIDAEGRPLLSPTQLRWCLEVRRKRKPVHLSGRSGLAGASTPVDGGPSTPVDGPDLPARPPQWTGGVHPSGRGGSTTVDAPENLSGRSGLAGASTPVDGPDPSPRTPIYEARTPAPAPAPARRVSEERRRDPEEQQQRPPGQKADESEVMKLIEEARGCVHFLIDPDDSTYQAVRDNVRVWLAKPGVDAELIREAYRRVKARERGPKPQGFVKYIEPIIVELRNDRERHERLWSADAAGSPQGPHASPAASKREAADSQWRADLEREKARRKELFGGED